MHRSLWFTMEVPTIFSLAWFLLTGDSAHINNRPNQVLFRFLRALAPRHHIFHPFSHFCYSWFTIFIVYLSTRWIREEASLCLLFLGFWPSSSTSWTVTSKVVILANMRRCIRSSTWHRQSSWPEPPFSFRVCCAMLSREISGSFACHSLFAQLNGIPQQRRPKKKKKKAKTTTTNTRC